MAVRIRMKKLGRKHRPFFRICAVDSRAPRDGRVLEELGTYDPMIPETDARAALNNERFAYWLGVGAQMSDRVKVL
ncbi:MAG: 30S ribosomal protein S16, partial [Planctomycetota bacterium]|nr:30S ribosomal protein S16 [Planctomycetota bacterium]